MKRIGFNEVLDKQKVIKPPTIEERLSVIEKQMKQLCMTLYCIDDNNKAKTHQLASAVNAWALMRNESISSKSWGHIYNFLLEKFGLNVHKEKAILNRTYPGISYLDTIVLCGRRDNKNYIDECNLYMLSCFTNYNYGLDKDDVNKYYAINSKKSSSTVIVSKTGNARVDKVNYRRSVLN